ncbi:MAG: hypothetical protein V7704_17005 [Aurantimonas endophytica]|uniref:hypothetical protein n=1 Tax=Aurantimonas endophytica TaxID=1522175 RepID=UPI00300215D2
MNADLLVIPTAAGTTVALPQRRFAWTPPLDSLCLYCYNRRNSSAAFQAYIALALDFTAGKLA